MDLVFLESVKKMPLMNLPVRSTFVRLKAGSILISPGSCLDFHQLKKIIVADLCFNLIDTKRIGSWIILNLFGTYRRLGMSKFFARFIDDKADFNESLTELFSFDFENIVVGHGENIFGNGKDKLLKALKERDLAPK